MKILAKILFIIISVLIAIVLIYYWQKPDDNSRYCQSRQEDCPKLWCKEVPCKQYEELPDGGFNLGECMKPTSYLPR